MQADQTDRPLDLYLDVIELHDLLLCSSRAHQVRVSFLFLSCLITPTGKVSRLTLGSPSFPSRDPRIVPPKNKDNMLTYQNCLAYLGNQLERSGKP
ncbi:hypothetical protein D3C85_519700 [compost metagenome]